MESLRVGQYLFTFDGQVLEVFGWMHTNIGIANQASVRFHVALLDITIDDPDRRGRRQIYLKVTPDQPASCDLTIEEADWPALSLMLARVQAAAAQR